MHSRFGSPHPNWQYARELARRRFTTRPLPISNFCTYVIFRQICIGINRVMISLSTDTKAAEKHAEFPDMPTADSSQKCLEREGIMVLISSSAVSARVAIALQSVNTSEAWRCQLL